MSLDEKIGQMLMVGIDGTEVDDDFKEFAEARKKSKTKEQVSIQDSDGEAVSG